MTWTLRAAILGCGMVCGLAAADGAVPRPEHPMPQMVRAEWLNLNGTWDFWETDDAKALAAVKRQPPEKIVVPFCRESKLSGLARRGFMRNVAYRRTFTVPETWTSPRVRLHIGACDYRTTVSVNGKEVGAHTGGSAAFAFDITDALKKGDNTLDIDVFDDTRSGLQPCGKQSQQEESNGCVYTRTTGIWQTVWLEGVGEVFIKEYFLMPQPNDNLATLRVELEGPDAGVDIYAEAFADGQPAGVSAVTALNRAAMLQIPISSRRLWTPEDPFLYDLKLRVAQDGKVMDALHGYFGLRTVTVQGAAILINGKPVFQRLVLDQGFYPDGIWTAPSDEALRRDIELSKAVGFNGARLHQKVFEPRFLYWADKLGYLVWGEFPSWGASIGKSEVDLPYIDEWLEVVRRDRNHPSIVGWCPFNETPPPFGPTQNTTVFATREADPTRPVIDSSGYFHGLPDPQILDTHDYDQNPQTFRDRWFQALSDAPLPPQYGENVTKFVPFFVSEYGGIGWNIDGKGWGYGNIPKTLEDFYTRFKGLTDALLDNPRMFGYCYTQLTNIEQEQNGVYMYDRTPKFDCDRLKAIQSRAAAYEQNPPLVRQGKPVEWAVLVGACPDGDKAKPWQFTTDKPADNWNTADFDAGSWKESMGGFGRKGGSDQFIKTRWSTSDIWLRQTFEFAGDAFAKALLVTHYDNDTEVYVNGKQVWSGQGWNDRYAPFDITEKLKEAVKPGTNLVAVHCRQETGGQFIDAALLVSK